MAKLSRVELIKKYIEDTTTSWEADSEYTEGCVDTGKDILDMISRIESGYYDEVDGNATIDW